MHAVSVTELRNHLPKYLSSAQQGKEIVVTSHGEIIARIMPPLDTQADALKKLKKLRKTCKIIDVISPIE